MTEDSFSTASGRRSVLKALGLLGAAAAAGPAAADTGSSATPQMDDSGAGDAYHQSLRATLTAGSRQQKQLPAGEYVYATTEAAALDAFEFHGAGSGSEQRIEVTNEAVPVTVADRLDIVESPTNPYDYTYKGTIPDREFSAGDLLLGVAWVRSDTEMAEARAEFKYEYTDPDGNTAYSSSAVARGATIDPDGEWMRYFFPIEVGEKPDGSDHTPFLEFWTGYAEQTIDIGGLALFDYSGSDVSLGTLPPYDYAGRGPDADWRSAAQDRIEDIRMTDVEVNVVDPDGNAVADADVEVSMDEHAFDFGTAVTTEYTVGNGEDAQRYQREVVEKFNKAVIENGMKFPAWEGVWDIDNDDTMTTLQWLADNDIPVRGHYLLWEEFGTDGGGGMNVDSALPPAELRQEISDKIASHLETFEGMVTEWDMHNHPIWQSNFRDMDALGWDAVDEFWATAEETAPDVELYTNEMGVVGGTWQRSQYLEYIQHLVDNDYPLDGIGFMGHHQQQWNQLLPVDEILSGFDEFGQFGVPILITEFDIQIFDRRNAQDVSVQADYTRDFLTAAFSHEAVEGVLSWGFWAGKHWRPTGAYYDEDWALRENGEVYFDLVFDEWWTDERGTTDADGTFTTRGFKGDYTVSASTDSMAGETTATFDDDAGTVTVELSATDGHPADLDGDGLNEDVNGDGEETILDVQALLDDFDSEGFQADADAYDFNDDGRLTILDVVSFLRNF